MADWTDPDEYGAARGANNDERKTQEQTLNSVGNTKNYAEKEDEGATDIITNSATIEANMVAMTTIAAVSEFDLAEVNSDLLTDDEESEAAGPTAANDDGNSSTHEIDPLDEIVFDESEWIDDDMDSRITQPEPSDEEIIQDFVNESLLNYKILHRRDLRRGKHITHQVEIEVRIRVESARKIRQHGVLNGAIEKIEDSIHSILHTSVPGFLFDRIPKTSSERSVDFSGGGGGGGLASSILTSVGSFFGSVGAQKQENCFVCDEPLQNRPPVRRLFCQHEFHEWCLKNSLRNQARCPSCGDCVVCKNDEFKVLIFWKKI